MIKTFSHHTQHCSPPHGQAVLFSGHTVEQAGENRAGVSSAGGSGRAPSDSVRPKNAHLCPEILQGATWLQTAAAAALDTLSHSTSCSVSLGSHWLWEEGHTLSATEPVLRLGCVSVWGE